MNRVLTALTIVVISLFVSCVPNKEHVQEQIISYNRDYRLFGVWKSQNDKDYLLKIENNLPSPSFGYFYTRSNAIFSFNGMMTPNVEFNTYNYVINGDTLYLSNPYITLWNSSVSSDVRDDLPLKHIYIRSK